MQKNAAHDRGEIVQFQQPRQFRLSCCEFSYLAIFVERGERRDWQRGILLRQDDNLEAIESGAIPIEGTDTQGVQYEKPKTSSKVD